jgi:hypothetical protein
MVEVVSDEEGTDCHSKFLIGPLDALAPAVPLAQDTQQDLAEFDTLLLILVNHVRHNVHN